MFTDTKSIGEKIFPNYDQSISTNNSALDGEVVVFGMIKDDDSLPELLSSSTSSFDECEVAGLPTTTTSRSGCKSA